MAESFEADVRVDDRVDAELGVDALVQAGKSLSIESWGRGGRWRAGAVDGRS